MRKLTRRDALLGLSAAALTIPRRGSIAAALDFSSLQSRFSGQLVTSESASYEKLRRTNNLAFDHRPVLIARCTNTSDVVRVLDYARSHHLPLAVRGGGHSLAGYSSCDGGVVIDLERIDAVSVDGGHAQSLVGAEFAYGRLMRLARKMEWHCRSESVLMSAYRA